MCVCVCACVTAEVSTLFTHKEGNDVHYETDGVRHHTASKFKHYNRSPDEFAMGLLNLKKKRSLPICTLHHVGELLWLCCDGARYSVGGRYERERDMLRLVRNVTTLES